MFLLSSVEGILFRDFALDVLHDCGVVANVIFDSFGILVEI